MGNPGERWTAAMRAGAFEAAWRVSDSVLADRDPGSRDDPLLPYHQRWVWDGCPVDGRRVLVRCYHGLGDTLQFCRFLAPLRRRAAHVTLEVQPALLPLLQPLPGPDAMIPFNTDAPAPAPDCAVEIMELSHALRLAPRPAPYLSAAPLPRSGPGLLVGLCWRAGGWDPRRSVPLAALDALGRIPGVRVAGLQRGPGETAPWVSHPWGASMDILDTARQIATVDVVVTIDTMVAHLAGALGRPTWLLLHTDADWRWMAGRRDSSWYGSIRLYRQARAGCWADPVAQVARDLSALAREPQGVSAFVGCMNDRHRA